MDSENVIEFIPDFPLDDAATEAIENMVAIAMDAPNTFEWEKNKKSMRAIVVDIDGTLADVRGGVGKTKKGEFDWENFFGCIPYYPTNEWCVRLTQIYYQMGFVVYIVSGRPGEYRMQTEKWLSKYSIPYDFLHMRPEGDKRPDEVVKQEILDTLLPKKDLIEFVVDDRQAVVDMWRANGLTCLQCNPHPEL